MPCTLTTWIRAARGGAGTELTKGLHVYLLCQKTTKIFEGRRSAQASLNLHVNRLSESL